MTLRRVLWLSAESSPLVKVGGLGDVVGSLPRALRSLGLDVRVAIPHYAVHSLSGLDYELRITFPVSWGGRLITASVAQVDRDDIPHYLIGGGPVEGSRVYGAGIEEDGPKFVFFALAALAALRRLEWKPDAIHVHDYHPAAAIYWLAAAGQGDEFFHETAAVLTIHNLAYQGNHAGEYLGMAGLGPSADPRLPDWARDGLMALGIAHADAISAVSPGYAREILGEELGAGLDGLLRARADRLRGILNGIDYAVWNPKTDRALTARFDAHTLDRRAENKAALQRECGLAADDSAPLIGAVSRLDHQKGFDIAAPAILQLLTESDAQFVLLGAGAPAIQAPFEALARDFPGRASVNLRFDPPLAARIYAGCDVFLMPSRYEPCGLAQMIAMRYGAVPVVRATGGLKDTVADYPGPDGAGFVFGDYSAEALLAALRRALAAYRDKRRWRGLQRRGMKQDFSWDKSAAQYLALYRQAVQWRREAKGPAAAVP